MDADGNNNLVSPFNSLLYQNMQQSSESRSEASSVESDWSDLNSIAIQMGVNLDNLADERFKVDRQKLENMIKDSSATEGTNAAEYFFDNIIKTTSTRISWPCRLKIGAKTKKDPHVRIVGKKMDVMKAKDRVLAVLDSRGCRVIMKMDISYTDHSYIIGRGGNNIKKIMEDTLTHIHFPDSNRSNPTEKSNQVSLCGSMEGVEKARSLVRLSTPLIISFELSIISPGQPMPDNNTDYVKEVEEKFNIQVIFSSRSKLHSSLVLVKGSENQAGNVRDATYLLIIHTCKTSNIPVNLQLEISPQHHDIVKGPNNMHLLSIMEQTKTKIIFPDLNDVNIKPIKKSQVTITGSIDAVHNARQQLIGNLPVALIFDSENSIQDKNDDRIKTLNHKFGVYIVARQKSPQSTLCIVIKGVEKYVDKIYQARHILLDLPPPMVRAEIPKAYFGNRETNLTSPTQCKNLVDISLCFPNSPITPGIVPNFPSFPNAQFENQYGNHLMAPNQTELFQRMPNLQLSPTNIHHLHEIQQKALQHLQSSNGHSMNGFNLRPPSTQLSYLSGRSSVSPRSSDTGNSGYFSNLSNSTSILNTSGSANSLEQMYPPYNPNIQIDFTNEDAHNYSQSENQTFTSSTSGNAKNLPCRLNENSGNHSFDEDINSLTPSFDLSRAFDRRRIEGFKAMEMMFETPKSGKSEVTPTNVWAGYGLSKTSPYALEAATAGMQKLLIQPREKIPFDKVSTTGLIDSIPSADRIPISQYKDIHTLLHFLKLEHYIGNFRSVGIDMNMFAALTAEDLLELNITAFGARKRLLLAINQLKIEMKSSGDRIELSEFEDIHSLLKRLKMEHYSRQFVIHEIDMKMFMTLSSNDLADIGIETFVDRKRLLMAIDQLKSKRFPGSAAPGAERRPRDGK